MRFALTETAVEPAQPPQRRGRVLIIEDNQANLELMCYLLEASGHATLVARDGSEGLEVASRETPDLIICDLQMPKMDGFQVVRRLKDDPGMRHIPLVAVTAFAMVGDRDKVLAAGFDGYLSKPIVPETFVKEMETFLHSATILVVDNSPANLQLASSVLEPFGYRVVAANGAKEALALAEQSPPDLILSDVHMPHQSGFDLIQAVKARADLRSIPFVFISSTVWRDSDQATGLALGAARFILRPIEPQDLVAAIEDLVPAPKKNPVQRNRS